MKILSFFFALLFVACAVVQLNDPDGIYWVVGYLLLAVFSVASGLGKIKSSWHLIVVALLGIGLVYYGPGCYQFLTNDDGIAFSQGMQNNYPYIEEAREFGGLLISTILVLVMWRGAKLRETTS